MRSNLFRRADALARFLRRLQVRVVSDLRAAVLRSRGATIGRRPVIGHGVRVTGRAHRLVIGDHVVLEPHVRLTISGAGTAEAARLEIGNDTFVGQGTHLVAHRDLRIGAGVLVAAYCFVTEANHGMVQDLPIAAQPQHAAPIRIGAGAWLGVHAVVLPGVTIGDGAVVGANAVVRNDVPAHMVATGIPARVTGSRPAQGA